MFKLKNKLNYNFIYCLNNQNFTNYQHENMFIQIHGMYLNWY